jgi:hypothetical protein
MATATPLDLASARELLTVDDVRRGLTPEQRAEADAATAQRRAQGSPDEVFFVAKDKAELDAWARRTFGRDALEVVADPADLTALIADLSCATTR